MRATRAVIALFVVSVSAETGSATAASDSSAETVRRLEESRRQQLRDNYDEDVDDPPPIRAGAGAARGPGELAPGGRRVRVSPKDNVQRNSSLGDGRTNSISRRDLAGGPALTDSEEVDLKRDPYRKAFLDNLRDLEDQLQPKYLEPNQEHHDYRKSIKGNAENPPYVEDNGVRRYRVDIDARQMIRNQVNDGLPSLNDDILKYEAGEDWQDINKKPEFSNDNLHNKGNYYNRGYEGNQINYDKANQNVQGYQGYDGNNLIKNDHNTMFRAQDSESQEDTSGSEDNSGETSGEDSGETSGEKSVESGKQMRDINESEYKEENVKSRYLMDWRRDAGGGRGFGEMFAARRDRELMEDETVSNTPYKRLQP